MNPLARAQAADDGAAGPAPGPPGSSTRREAPVAPTPGRRRRNTTRNRAKARQPLSCPPSGVTSIRTARTPSPPERSAFSPTEASDRIRPRAWAGPLFPGATQRGRRPVTFLYRDRGPTLRPMRFAPDSEHAIVMMESMGLYVRHLQRLQIRALVLPEYSGLTRPCPTRHRVIPSSGVRHRLIEASGKMALAISCLVKPTESQISSPGGRRFECESCRARQLPSAASDQRLLPLAAGGGRDSRARDAAASEDTHQPRKSA